ncbi:MAG: archease [Chloroflexota bacterium]
MTLAVSDYFDHEADIGVIGRGPTVEDALVAAAGAVFAIMADPASIRPERRVDVRFEESDVELAMVTWLNLLIGEARARGLIFGRFELRREGDAWLGSAWGEPWRSGIERGTEVKGATLTALSVNQTEDGWDARCVVDV